MRRRGPIPLLLALLLCYCITPVALLSPDSSSPYGLPEPRAPRDLLRHAYDRYQKQQDDGMKQHLMGDKEEAGRRHEEERRHRVGRQDMYHGTTTCSFVFDGGILVAVDSRASMGSYIGTGAAEKVIPVSRKILGTMAGGAADCSFWLRHLAMQVRLYEEQEGEEMTVARASKILASRLARYLGQLSVGTMVMGHDRRQGFSIYYVDNEGVRTRGQLFAVGSGSTYAYGILDSGYRRNLTVEEAMDLGLRAIRHATYRDAFSGGFINVFLVTEHGWRRLARLDSGTLDMHGNNSTATPSGAHEATSHCPAANAVGGSGEEEGEEEEERGGRPPASSAS